MPRRNRTITNPYIWNKKAVPVKDSDDKRGKFRHDMDRSMGRAMTRYLGNILEWKFPHIDLKITDGTWVINVTTSTTHTCPITTINGDVNINGNVVINGNLTVNGLITATVDVIGAGVSLKSHTHPGCSGGSTGSPS